MGHRKGAKKRPQCKGKLMLVRMGSKRSLDEDSKAEDDAYEAPAYAASSGLASFDTLQTFSTDSNDEESFSSEQADFSFGDDNTPVGDLSFSDEGVLGDDEDPTEALARRMLQASIFADVDGIDLTEVDSVGATTDLIVQPAPAGPNITTNRVNVEVPNHLLVMYNWCQDQGWDQGDGSFSSWILDMVMCHWGNCMGKQLAVVSKWEIEHAKQGILNFGPNGTGPSRNHSTNGTAKHAV